jgi:hypothetical protein
MLEVANLGENPNHSELKLWFKFASIYAKAYAQHMAKPLEARIAALEAALAECHDALQSEESHHASEDYVFTDHPLLAKDAEVEP